MSTKGVGTRDKRQESREEGRNTAVSLRPPADQSIMRTIFIGFNADPDPAFYLNADPDPGSQTNADPDPGQTLPSQKLNFCMKNTF